MSTLNLLKLHPLLSDRIRLSIMGILATAEGPVSFNELIETMEVSKGNLSTHMKKLEDEGLVEVIKTFVDRKPRTTYICTTSGRQALKQYLTEIQNLLAKTG